MSYFIYLMHFVIIFNDSYFGLLEQVFKSLTRALEGGSENHTVWRGGGI